MKIHKEVSEVVLQNNAAMDWLVFLDVDFSKDGPGGYTTGFTARGIAVHIVQGYPCTKGMIPFGYTNAYSHLKINGSTVVQ